MASPSRDCNSPTLPWQDALDVAFQALGLGPDYSSEAVCVALAQALRQCGVRAQAVSCQANVLKLPAQPGALPEALNQQEIYAVRVGQATWIPEGARSWTQALGVLAHHHTARKKNRRLPLLELEYVRQVRAMEATPDPQLVEQARQVLSGHALFVCARGRDDVLDPPAGDSGGAPVDLVAWVEGVRLAQRLGVAPPDGPSLTAIPVHGTRNGLVGAWAPAMGAVRGPLGGWRLVTWVEPSVQAVLRREVARRAAGMGMAEPERRAGPRL